MDIRNSCSRQVRRWVVDPLIHRFATPTTQHLLHVGGSAHHDAEEALAALLGTPGDGRRIRSDFEGRREELRGRLARDPDRRIVPDYYDVEPRTAQFLYSLVRALRPSVVVETGVANGVSSFFLASALLDNGSGSLCSIDVRPDVAPFLSARERQVWQLVVLPQARRRALGRALDALGPIDLFVHDSHHTYGWQMAEYELASARMRPGAVLASDDVDASFAFATFCDRHRLRAEFLFDRRKFFGATRWGGTSCSER